MKPIRNIFLLLLSLACLGLTLYALLEGGDPGVNMTQAAYQSADSLEPAWASTRDSLRLK